MFSTSLSPLDKLDLEHDCTVIKRVGIETFFPKEYDLGRSSQGFKLQITFLVLAWLWRWDNFSWRILLLTHISLYSLFIWILRQFQYTFERMYCIMFLGVIPVESWWKKTGTGGDLWEVHMDKLVLLLRELYKYLITNCQSWRTRLLIIHCFVLCLNLADWWQC